MTDNSHNIHNNLLRISDMQQQQIEKLDFRIQVLEGKLGELERKIQKLEGT